MVSKELVAGVDIGGTNTRYALVDGDGTIVARGSVKTSGYPDPETFFRELCRHIEVLLASQNGTCLLKGYGIGAPKGNIRRGTMENAANMPWHGIIPVSEIITAITGLPAVTGNDANAAAAGELYYGGAKEMKNFIVVTLGTGVGSGFVTDGRLLNGHRGFAGELGHTDVVTTLPPRRCNCGRTGCLEAYCSVTGLVATARMLLESEGQESALRGIDRDMLTGEAIWEAAMKNDLVAMEAFNITGEILGRALANAVAITDPEAIFLSGGLARAGNLIFKPTIHSMERNLLDVYHQTVKLLPSKLDNNQSAALAGAASLFLTHNELTKTL